MMYSYINTYASVCESSDVENFKLALLTPECQLYYTYDIGNLYSRVLK